MMWWCRQGSDFAKGKEEMVIAAIWIMDSIDRCVRFLPCHMMVQHTARYDRALAQLTYVFSVNPMCHNSTEHSLFHKNRGCCED